MQTSQRRLAAGPGEKVGAGSRLTDILRLAFWFSIVISLLNYGAYDSVTVAIETGFVYLLLVLGVFSLGIAGNVRMPVVTSIAALLLLLAWIVFQTAPLPEGWPVHPAWMEVRKLDPDVHASISVTPGDDFGAYLKIALPFGVFLLSLLLFRKDGEAERALRLYGVTGGIIAILSILQFVFAPGMLLFVEKTAYLDSLTGFFVNRNTAATFFGIVSLLLLTLLWRSTKDVDVRRFVATLAQPRPEAKGWSLERKQGLLYAGLLAASLLALLLTKSRAGVGLTFVSLSLLGILLGSTRYSRTQRASFGGRPKVGIARRLWLLVGLPLAFLVILAFLGGNVLLRAEVRGAEDPRFCTLPGIVASVKDHFPWGSGLASFQEVFPAYRDPACGVFAAWDKAHNVYLEGTLTLGIMFPLVAVIVMGSLIHIFIRGIRERREYRFAGCLGLAALLLVGLHSAFDFSLQIPGFSLVFALLMGPVVSICLGRGAGAFPQSSQQASGRYRVRARHGHRKSENA
ncbi:O-antigen ligase family protein [Rhizobium daejeonense]